MSEVYRAWDQRLRRSVAIKLRRQEPVQARSARRQLEREAQIVARLSHPNVCAVYDIGNHNGAIFIVMEYLDGETLAQRLRRGPVPPREALAYAIQIVDALDAAHRQGVTHPD